MDDALRDLIREMFAGGSIKVLPLTDGSSIEYGFIILLTPSSRKLEPYEGRGPAPRTP